ncbi:rodlin [Streptomyces sp. NPDC051597]|uniref:rodlin n=1 Tax=Streptomyces sp. NPDC051597 TaxID=3155049 RepID=UPI00342B7F6E
MQKLWSAATVAAAISGVTMMVAPQAMAIGNDDGPTAYDGNESRQAYGQSKTEGDMSPQMSLVQGSLNKLCLGALQKVDVQNIVALVNVGLQDIYVLTQQQNQQCTENSTQQQDDAQLSHILDNIPVLSGNAASGS